MSANLILSYDPEADVLEVRSEAPCPSYGEEIEDGVFAIRCMEDDRPIGYTVIGFAKRQAERGMALPMNCFIPAEALKQHAPAPNLRGI